MVRKTRNGSERFFASFAKRQILDFEGLKIRFDSGEPLTAKEKERLMSFILKRNGDSHLSSELRLYSARISEASLEGDDLESYLETLEGMPELSGVRNK